MKKARQLTLFECSKTVSSNSELDSDDNQSNDNEQPVKQAHIHCQDSSEETCRGTQPSSVHHAYGASNTITVQSSTGPTTVIINTDASKATESSTEIIKSSSSGDLSGPPMDIADRPGAPLVQPRNIEFPSTNFSGKLPTGTGTTLGWNTPCLQMLSFATHVDSSQLELGRQRKLSQ